MNRDRARGFTIIEMLTVTAVVCVLIAILWPVLQTPRHSGCGPRTCLSNMKRLGIAVVMYAQDYDDTLFWNPVPGGLSAGQWGSGLPSGNCSPQPSESFAVLLHPYVSSASVFQCPRFPGYALSRHLGYQQSLLAASAEPRISAPEASDSTAWPEKIGYGFNEVLVGGPCRPRTLDSLTSRPAAVALLADAEEPWASGSGVWVRKQGEWRRYWSLRLGESPRHGTEQERGQNFVFVDGHVKFLPPLVTDEESGRGYYPGARLE